MYSACKRNIEASYRSHCCRGKAVRITFSECVFVVLVTQHAKRMRGIILSSVVCPARIMFVFYPILSLLQGKIFPGGGEVLNIEGVLRF